MASASALAQAIGQLATLLRSGIPLPRALALVERVQPPGALRRALGQVQRDVDEGDPLADALARHPALFDAMVITTARAGAETGALGAGMAHLAEHMAQRLRIRRRIQRGLAVPLITSALATGVLVGLALTVVPEFERIFTDIGADLPLPTVWLLQATRFLSVAWPLLLGLAIVAAVGLRVAVTTDSGRRWWDLVSLRLPFAGAALRLAALGQLTRTLGTLIGAGVPLTHALSLARESTRNTMMQAATDRVQRSVTSGGPLAEPLAARGLLGPAMVGLLEVGEESGQMAEMLLRTADACDREASDTLEALAAVLQPLVTIGTGLTIAGLALVLFLPLIAIVERL